MRVVIAAAVAIETVIGLSGVKDCVHKTHISLILWLSVVLLSINRVVCLEREIGGSLVQSATFLKAGYCLCRLLNRR